VFVPHRAAVHAFSHPNAENAFFFLKMPTLLQPLQLMISDALDSGLFGRSALDLDIDVLLLLLDATILDAWHYILWCWISTTMRD